jgi:penicillin amidase
MAGSNCWAISGKYTESGSPYLANDPHLENSNPSSWYLSEHLYGDEFIIGATLIGIPFHLAGRTESIALGTTILRSDVADLFEEKI